AAAPARPGPPRRPPRPPPGSPPCFAPPAPARASPRPNSRTGGRADTPHRSSSTNSGGPYLDLAAASSSAPLPLVREAPSMKAFVKPPCKWLSLRHLRIAAHSISRITLLFAAPLRPAGWLLDPRTPYPFFGTPTRVTPSSLGGS